MMQIFLLKSTYGSVKDFLRLLYYLMIFHQEWTYISVSDMSHSTDDCNFVKAGLFLEKGLCGVKPTILPVSVLMLLSQMSMPTIIL